MKEKIKRIFKIIRITISWILLIVSCTVLVVFWGQFLMSEETFNDFLKELDEIIPVPTGSCIENCWFVG